LIHILHVSALLPPGDSVDPCKTVFLFFLDRRFFAPPRRSTMEFLIFFFGLFGDNPGLWKLC